MRAAENETGTKDAEGRSTEEKVGFWIGGSVEPWVGCWNQAGRQALSAVFRCVGKCGSVRVRTGFWASESCVFQVNGERVKAWRYVVETGPPIHAARDLNRDSLSHAFFHLATGIGHLSTKT